MKHAKRLLLVLIVILAACAPITVEVTPTPPPETSPGTADDLVGTQWTLVSYGIAGAENPVAEGSEVTLSFQADGQAGGSGGCNSYSAPYQAEDGMLTFGEIVSTLMACVDEVVMEQEQQYFQALQTAGQYELAAGQLTIYYDAGQGVLNFVSAGSATGQSAETPQPDGVSVQSPSTAQENNFVWLCYYCGGNEVWVFENGRGRSGRGHVGR
ncbi:MAG: hypothetical protein DCC55_16850 [Chloroflexi bacterium]|nr:MAG: hypothetical protein DCC55_16850 [Chloroflexota bacterium]